MEGFITDTTFKQNEIIKKIISFVSLNHDWGGFGALLEVESAANAISIINGLSNSEISAIYPNPHGTITLDWQI